MAVGTPSECFRGAAAPATAPGASSEANPPRRYRVLCIGETWLGSDARAAFVALRRLGNTIRIVDEMCFFPVRWRSVPLKALRKCLRPLFVQEVAREIIRLRRYFNPELLLVFKGNVVHPRVVDHFRQQQILTANYYPDGGFLDFGPYIPKALPLYDHVFTTKPFGIEDMRRELGVTRSTYLDHGFDPEIHRPVTLSLEELEAYSSDVAFVGSWSTRKESLLRAVREALPGAKLRIWGCGWQNSKTASLRGCIFGDEILDEDYTRAICGARIVLGLLTGLRPGASSGDVTTARTFQIPACGAFMLHERTPQALCYFEEGLEAAFFDSPDELVQKIEYYLGHPDERTAVAQAGFRRSHQSGYSIDDRMKTVIAWLAEKLPIARRAIE